MVTPWQLLPEHLFSFEGSGSSRSLDDADAGGAVLGAIGSSSRAMPALSTPSISTLLPDFLPGLMSPPSGGGVQATASAVASPGEGMGFGGGSSSGATSRSTEQQRGESHVITSPEEQGNLLLKLLQKTPTPQKQRDQQQQPTQGNALLSLFGNKGQGTAAGALDNQQYQSQQHQQQQQQGNALLSFFGNKGQGAGAGASENQLSPAISVPAAAVGGGGCTATPPAASSS